MAIEGNKLTRFKLNEGGDAIGRDAICYFKYKVRYHDITLYRSDCEPVNI